MTFPATQDSVRTARLFVAERVRPCPEERAADAILLVSELATNCVVHARSDYEVRVGVDGGRVRIEVSDRDPGLPSPSEDGRGLHLVIDLADRWGTDADDGGGKVVWFELG
jgi:anti-sigma regulatory factor (Ser/Thr protein kinase)